MSKNILFVNWGTLTKIFPFVVAHRKKLRVFLATSGGYPTWITNYVPSQQLILTNTYDSEKLIIDVARYLHAHRIVLDGITTFFEMNIVQTADLANTFGFKFISPAAAHRSSANKLLMRVACQNKGLPTPRFMAFNRLEDGFKALQGFKGPVVLKPIKSGHSFGCLKIENPRQLNITEFAKTWQQAQHHLQSKLDEWMEYFDYQNDFLLEEYIAGPTVSVDGLIQEGHVMIAGISEHLMGPEPLMVQEGVYIPARISAAAKQHCLAFTKRVLRALEFDHCGFHCEMRLTPQGPLLLEVAARPPGGDMLEGYQQAYGIDFAGLYLDICLGQKVNWTYRPNQKFVLQRDVFPRKKISVVKKISNLDKVQQLSSLKQLIILTNPGEPVIFQADFAQPVLYYVLVANTFKQLAQDESTIEANLQIAYAYNPIFFWLAKVRLLVGKLKTYLREWVAGKGGSFKLAPPSTTKT